MDARTFFDKVATMRRYQREYFKTRSRNALELSKRLESEVDAEIERVNRILGIPGEPKQTSLFGNGTR